MNSTSANRGGAPVGYINDLSSIEAGAVLYLRLWCSGSESQKQVWSDFSIALGSSQGRKALAVFEAICDICIRYGRRPLMRHHVSCKCLGADESCFANFIAYASEGDREDAILIATTIVRPDMALPLVDLAQEFGLTLQKMVLMGNNLEKSLNTFH